MKGAVWTCIRSSRRRYFTIIALALLSVTVNSAHCHSESLQSALARAYYANPDLNQSRSKVRAQDEEAPKALAGMRPKASIGANVGGLYGNVNIPFGSGDAAGRRTNFGESYVGKPRGATLNVSQTSNLYGDTSIISSLNVS
jgi:outer membrane protein